VTDGDWARTDICRDVPVGSLSPFELALTQGRDSAAGTVTLDDVAGPVQGAIQRGGQLTLAGAFTAAGEGIALDASITDWETTTTDNQRLSGRFALVFRAAGLQGTVRFNGELRIVAKTAAAPLSPTRGELSLRRALTTATRR
jgi:hypothetical protein